MHSVEEKDNTPLVDAEISRLIKVSREVGYKKQDQIPERDLVDFKPTKIDQIATQVSTEQSVKAEANITEKQEQDASQEVNLNSGDEKENSTEAEETNTLDVKLEKPEKESPSDIVTTEKIIEGTNTEKDDKQENSESDPVMSEYSSSPNENRDIEIARQEGIEIGRKLALSEIEAEQKEAINTLKMLVNNIKEKETLDKSDLLQSILDVVTHLASERAGIIIDETPEIFKNKILKFIDEIEHASKKIILNLNPKDANLIKEITTNPLHDNNIELKENSELLRGDFIIQVGSVEMGNLISKQILVREKETDEGNEPNRSLTEAEQSTNSKNPEEVAEPSAENEKNEIELTDNEKK